MTTWMLKLPRMECWMSKTTDSKEVYWQKKEKKMFCVFGDGRELGDVSGGEVAQIS